MDQSLSNLSAHEVSSMGSSLADMEAEKIVTNVTIVDNSQFDNTASTDDYTMNVFRGIFCAVGLVGNFLVIFVVVVLREYKKSLTHWYVLQLAVADCLFLVSMPLFMIEDISKKWTYPSWLCSASEAILFVNFYASVLFLLVMGVDRYIAVCQGFSDSWQKLRTKRAAMIITISIWLVSILLSLVPGLNTGAYYCRCQSDFSNVLSPQKICAREVEMLLGDPLYAELLDMCLDYQNSIYYCKTDPPPPNLDNSEYLCKNDDRRLFAFQIFNFVVMFVVPLAILILCYSLIILRIRKVQKRSRKYQSDSTIGVTEESSSTPKKSAVSAKDRRNRIRVTVMCSLLVVAFIVCWLPYHVVNMLRGPGIKVANQLQCQNIVKITSLITFLGSVLNPFIYNFIGTKFGERISSSLSSIRRRFSRRLSAVGIYSPPTSGRPSAVTAETNINMVNRRSPVK